MKNNNIIFKPDPQYIAACTAAATRNTQFYVSDKRPMEPEGNFVSK